MGYLVLSRKQGQTVVLTDAAGREVVVKVHRISGNTVRLAIQCERDVKVLRGELKARAA